VLDARSVVRAPTGTPAAVLNAVSDALAPFGVGIFEMPITPQRILQLLREAG
jgi:carbon-monoxide dehydrogenase large subunit